MPCIVGEVQLHLREILVLKESSLHRLYEIVRASSIDTLLAESARARRKRVAAAAGMRASLTAPKPKHNHQALHRTRCVKPLQPRSFASTPG